MTTFTWKITAVDSKDRIETFDEKANAVSKTIATVTQIHWELTGVDGDKTASNYGVVNTELKDTDLSDEKSLMKELKKVLGKEGVAAEEQRIEELLNPSE